MDHTCGWGLVALEPNLVISGMEHQVSYTGLWKEKGLEGDLPVASAFVSHAFAVEPPQRAQEDGFGVLLGCAVSMLGKHGGSVSPSPFLALVHLFSLAPPELYHCIRNRKSSK